MTEISENKHGRQWFAKNGCVKAGFGTGKVEIVIDNGTVCPYGALSVDEIKFALELYDRLIKLESESLAKTPPIPNNKLTEFQKLTLSSDGAWHLIDSVVGLAKIEIGSEFVGSGYVQDDSLSACGFWDKD